MLEERIRRHPADRFPIQHATAQFHLGLALMETNRFDDAERALAGSARLFADAGLGTERAKAENALGSLLRVRGRLDDAERAFARAITGFEAAGMHLELGAARFNRGLVQRERGDLDGALRSFEQAAELLGRDSAPAQAAAASRELGTTLMLADDPEAAARVLDRSLELARAIDDPEAVGGAANALGLAHLRTGHPEQAVEAFETALTAHPRSVRAERYAMTKANLALALERAGEPAHARLSANQALSVTSAPDAVRTEASGVLERLGPGHGDLVRVLERESRERWPTVLRDEVESWIGREPDQRRRAASDWISAAVEHRTAPDLAEAWLAALLELPPAQMDVVVEATMDALADGPAGKRDEFRALTARAMLAFHEPQALRLQRVFESIAAARGGPTGWS